MFKPVTRPSYMYPMDFHGYRGFLKPCISMDIPKQSCPRSPPGAVLAPTCCPLRIVAHPAHFTWYCVTPFARHSAMIFSGSYVALAGGAIDV